MRHFPIFLDLRDKTIVLAGAGDIAAAKLRVLLKTDAELCVFAPHPCREIETWANQGVLKLKRRRIRRWDIRGATLVYAATGDKHEDQRIARLTRKTRALFNMVDNLDTSDFLTPAIVDRDPVIVAIGTEGIAPVLARSIKAKNEAQLNPQLGELARAAKQFRPRVNELPHGKPRREFWSHYYDVLGPKLVPDADQADIIHALEALLDDKLNAKPKKGNVTIIGTGPGDPELLTLKARNQLHDADVVIYDRLVCEQIIELARREATLICVGKAAGQASWQQKDINQLMIKHAQRGEQVIRLKGGDICVFARLDDEMDALDAAGVPFELTPGITTASAAAANASASLTKRGRNSHFQYLTGHDVDGFADHDWRDLAKLGQTAAIYMPLRAAQYLQSRLLAHGADPLTPMTIAENVSRPTQKLISTNLVALKRDLAKHEIDGPAVLLLGITPRHIKGANQDAPKSKVYGNEQDTAAAIAV